MPRLARSLAAALLFVLCAAAAAAPAQARVVAASRSGYAAGPALAADGRLVVGERTARGAIPVTAVDPAGARAPQRLATFPAPRAPFFAALTLTGTGGTVGAQVDTRVFADPHTGGTELRASEGRTLLPSSALGACPHASAFAGGIGVAGGIGFAATRGEDCGAIGRAIRVHGLAGVRTLPVAPGAQTSVLRAAGRYVAWAETTPGGHAVVLADAITGTVLARAATGGFGAQDIGIGADGTVVWITQSGFTGCTTTMFAIAPGHPDPRVLSGPGTPCAFGADGARGSITVAGGLVVYPSVPAFAVTDGSGTGHLVPELPAVNGAAGPIAFDGHTLYGVRAGCEADQLLGVDVTAIGSPPAPATAPDGPGCPAARRGSAQLRPDAGRAIHVQLSCPAGCHGTLRLVQQRALRERVAGLRDVSGHGAFTARVQLPRWAAGLAACGGGLRLRATLYRDALPAVTRAPRTPLDLGVLRVRSAAPCRHIAGPAFERRVPIP